ncbi:hypothetical protein A2U01_0108082, partial [Trifolium medium]|nr:hypothetical protein [Trifolium medium]
VLQMGYRCVSSNLTRDDDRKQWR